MPAIDLNSREYFNRRVGALENEVSSFTSHWMELSENFSPRRGRFLIDDRNRGERKHQNIINSAGLQAARVSRSGLLAGIMSPARPWFALETLNPDFMESEEVKVWLHRVELLMRTIFNQSNLYNMAPTMLGEITVFGTGCMTQLDDFNDVARFYTHTVGSYMVAQNERYEIDTLVRQYMLTVHQMVKEFGLNKVSILVKDRWDRGDYDQWFPVTQVIEPNPNFDFDKLDSQFKPWRSIHFEPGNDKGANLNTNKFLRRSGFEEFPAFVPRWSVTGEDIYGTDCPGMIALGDNKGLQIEERRKAQAIDKMVNPPLRGPASLRNSPINTMPGGTNFYAGMPESKLEAVYQTNPQIAELKEDIRETERRIQEAFYADMFLAISNMDGVQPRNQLELTQRNEERLLQLGPVLEQFHNEFLAKMIDRTFAQMGRADLLPPAPQALQGQPLRINFISSLARAQRAVAVGGIERLAGFAGQLAQAKPEVLDKIDADQMIDEYAQALGTTPNLVVPDETVDIIRQQRQQQQQAMQAMATAQAGAAAAKDASQADMSGENLLSNAVNAAQG
jgi:hypothetical protein